MALLHSTISALDATTDYDASTWLYFTLLHFTVTLLVYYTLQLAIEKAWSALDGLVFCFLVQTSVENSPSPCRDSISGFLGRFQSGGVFSGQRALTIECLVMSGYGLGHELEKNL